MKYTDLQGQYLVFIYYYKKINKEAPAHLDFQKYFGSTPPSVNDMLKKLENKSLIERVKGKPRSVKLLLTKEELPELI
jgi:repressor LexA